MKMMKMLDDFEERDFKTVKRTDEKRLIRSIKKFGAQEVVRRIFAYGWIMGYKRGFDEGERICGNLLKNLVKHGGELNRRRS
jgi:hypothetical protein